MKKIIITTFFKAENYGAALQAYALEQILLQKGYDVEILNYRDESIESVYKIFNCKNKSLYLVFRAYVGIVLLYQKKKKRKQKFLEFQREYLIIGDKEYRSVEDIKKDPPCADIYITGSDQVWNTSITKGLSDVYTLNFGFPQTKRIAYAASIGNNHINVEEQEMLKEKISNMDWISVREATAQNILVDLLPEKAVSIMLDPVLLRKSEEWNADIFAYCSRNVNKKYILAYQVEENKEFEESVNALSKITGLGIIHFEKIKKYRNAICSSYTEGPLEFINLIKNAEYVITASFHGTAFSVVFQKKFWVFPHQFTGSRATDLLHTLEIPERAVYTQEEFLAHNYDKEIDYQKVNGILERERKRSLEWLDTALKEGYGKR